VATIFELETCLPLDKSAILNFNFDVVKFAKLTSVLGSDITFVKEPGLLHIGEAQALTEQKLKDWLNADGTNNFPWKSLNYPDMYLDEDLISTACFMYSFQFPVKALTLNEFVLMCANPKFAPALIDIQKFIAQVMDFFTTQISIPLQKDSTTSLPRKRRNAKSG